MSLLFGAIRKTFSKDDFASRNSPRQSGRAVNQLAIFFWPSFYLSDALP
jgi:hypothetical protein